MRRFLALLSVASSLAAPPVVAQAPLKTLAEPDAEYAEPFTQINGVRELRDGRVIVFGTLGAMLVMPAILVGRRAAK
jgi:hypothetical protein